MIQVIAPPVSAIADVLALWGRDGWLTPPLQSIIGTATSVSGQALTISITIADSGPGLSQIYDVLSSDLSDKVLVLAGAADLQGAVWGEILTAAALQCGASAVLVDGWVRDRQQMATLGLPVYARGERVVGPGPTAHIVSVGTEVALGHDRGSATIIANDDLVVVDASGCVRVPAASAEQVLEAAQRYSAAEDLVASAIAEGEPLASAYRHKKAIVTALVEEFRR